MRPTITELTNAEAQPDARSKATTTFCIVLLVEFDFISSFETGMLSALDRIVQIEVGLQVTGYRLQVTGYRLQVTGMHTSTSTITMYIEHCIS